MKALHGLFIFLGFLSVILLAVSGPLYKSGTADLGTAFLMLRWALYIGAAAFVLNIIWYFVPPPRSGGGIERFSHCYRRCFRLHAV